MPLAMHITTHTICHPVCHTHIHNDTIFITHNTICHARNYNILITHPISHSIYHARKTPDNATLHGQLFKS